VKILLSLLAAAGPEDAVMAAAAGWTEAAVRQDRAGLEKYLATDLQYAHAGGNTQTKQQYIAAVTSGPARYERFTFSDVTVRFYGPVAVLTGHVEVKMTGQEAFRVRTLQVYTRDGETWQMAAHQSTRITAR
jgi:ketosteroid isomerase-like protein